MPAFEGPRAAPPAVSAPAGEPEAEVTTAVLDLPYRDARGAVTGAFELRYLQRLLERSAGNVSQAARLAQMDRSYLLELLARHGLRGRGLAATASGSSASSD